MLIQQSLGLFNICIIIIIIIIIIYNAPCQIHNAYSASV